MQPSGVESKRWSQRQAGFAGLARDARLSGSQAFETAEPGAGVASLWSGFLPAQPIMAAPRWTEMVPAEPGWWLRQV